MANLDIFCLKLFKELKLANLMLLVQLKDNNERKTHPFYSLNCYFFWVIGNHHFTKKE